MNFTKTYNQKVEEFETHLKRIFGELKDVPDLLYKAIEYSLINGGKRMRPILLLETYRIFNGEPDENVIKFAVAVECVHIYSLIHDDLPAMDNDDFRRGRPSNHKMFGDGVAILAGDALLNLAYELIIEAANNSNNHKAYLKAAGYFSKSMGARGLIAGQVVDIKAGSESVTGDMLKFVIRHKTGNLVIAPCAVGAILGGATKEEIEHIVKFADFFSYAFQIRDDVLDYNDKGKEDNNTSFVKVYGKSRAVQTLGDSTQKARKMLDLLVNRDTTFFKAMTMKFALRKS